MKKFLPFILVFGFLVLMVVIITLLQPKKVDWHNYFSDKKKSPYGSSILFNELKNIYPNQKIITTKGTPVETIMENFKVNENFVYSSNPENKKLPKGYNWIIITDNFYPNYEQGNALKEFAAAGNTVFVAAEYFSNALADSFGLSTSGTLKTYFVESDSSNMANQFTQKVWVTNAGIEKPKVYTLPAGTGTNWFGSFDKTQAYISGVNDSNRVNMIRIPVGKGEFIFNTIPHAFTNYVMLHEKNADYVAECFSQTKNGPVIWDSYYKPGRQSNNGGSNIDMPSIDRAMTIIVITAILFVLFMGKRKQRIIPVIEPVKNKTLEFVNIVGRLYYQRQAHKSIALTRIDYLLDYIRNKYYMTTEQLNAEFYTRLSEKSGVAQSQVTDLMSEVNSIQNADSIDRNDLMSFNQKLENFYNNAK